MALEITHSFVSEKSQSPDPTIVSTNEWNDTHSIVGLDSGIETWLESATASDLLAALDSVTGTGAAVFATAPTFPTTITIGAAGGNTGEIRLKGTTSGTVTLKVADAAGTYTLTMPTDDGEADYVLATDGSGVLSWVEQTGGGGGGIPTQITVADEAADTTSFIAFFTAASGDLGPKTNANLTFDAATGVLTAAQPIAGSVTGNAATVTLANEATDTTCFLAFGTAATGNLGLKTNANLAFNSSTGVLTVGQPIAGSITGNAGTITIADEATDTTCFPLFATAATGDLGPKTNAGLTFNSSTGALGSKTLTLTQGTITDVATMIDGTVTWNDAADTFTAWKLNVTNTNSNAASLLLDLQVGGTSQLKVSRTGTVTVAAQTTGAFGIGATTAEYISFWGGSGTGTTIVGGNSGAGIHLRSTGVVISNNTGNDPRLGFETTFNLGNSADLFIYRDAANTLAQRNSTNAQITRGYRTFTDTSNYERWALQSGAGYFELAAETAGTGTDNISLRLTTAGTGSVDIYPGGSGPLNIGYNSTTSAATLGLGGGGIGYMRNGGGGSSKGGFYLVGSSGGINHSFGWASSTSAEPLTSVGLGTTLVVSIENGSLTQAGGTIRYIPTTPAQITGNQDNYNPGGTSFFQRWSTDASRNVTGLTFTAAQINGQTHMIVNVGSADLVIKHNVTSTAANRFQCSTGADITLTAGQQALLIYDATSSGNFPAWRVSKMN